MPDTTNRKPIAARQIFMSYAFDGTQRAHVHPFCPSCGTARTAGDSPSLELCPGCGYRAFRNPYPGVCVLVVDHDRFLLVRRRESTFRGGTWCLPQGYVEYHEDFLTAARREVQEEAGVAIHITGLLSVTSNFLDPRHHSLGIVLLGELLDANAELQPGDDATEAAWFTDPWALPEMAFESDAHIIQRHASGGLSLAPVDIEHATWR